MSSTKTDLFRKILWSRHFYVSDTVIGLPMHFKNHIFVTIGYIYLYYTSDLVFCVHFKIVQSKLRRDANSSYWTTE